jgi:hypothetical protein
MKRLTHERNRQRDVRRAEADADEVVDDHVSSLRVRGVVVEGACESTGGGVSSSRGHHSVSVK